MQEESLTIKIKPNEKTDLDSIGSKTQTYNDIIRGLIRAYRNSEQSQ